MTSVSIPIQLQNHHCALERFSFEIENINKQINSHRNLIQEANDRVSVPIEFDKFKSSLQESIKSLQSSIANASGQLTLHKMQLDELKSKINLHEKKLGDLESCLHELKTGFLKSLEEHSRKQDNFIQSSQSAYTQLRLIVEKKIEDCHEKLKKVPEAIVCSNQEILNKVELSLLDSSNAMLKVNNTDMNMRVLERKLENVSLQLKKLDLSQQKV